jgi:choline dehydrogenase-like flavoprotein
VNHDADVIIIGSGAGAGPVAYTLSHLGFSVIVLEKGPWLKEKDFNKDEIANCRRSVLTPNLRDERHVIEQMDDDGKWSGESTYDSGRDFWNGNFVGGSSNLMSGFFHRNKPVDFRLLSEFGPIEGANVADWPISYDEMEPYYDKVEKIVGVSGKVVDHPYQEPRSIPDFPFPPTAEHPLAKRLDEAGEKIGYNPFPLPRAILPYDSMNRGGCVYSDYCGSYPCATGAKGSARAALLDKAVATGKCEIRPHSMAFKIETDSAGKITGVKYYNSKGKVETVNGKIYVAACQAIETSRLLLMSRGPKFPNGLANNHGQVGKNLIFSAGGIGGGDFLYEELDEQTVNLLKIRGLFTNRALQDWYIINDGKPGRMKGGTIDFLLRHSNPIARANREKWDDNGYLRWGHPLKHHLKSVFTGRRTLTFEVFNDWLPTDNCFVTLDPKVKDKWGNPVARFRIGYHPHDLEVGSYLAEKAEKLLAAAGAKNIYSGISGSPPANLQAGGCRFGTDPENSVLDPDCRSHEVENLYVTDGSFMPTGGSVTYTWTIYANAFRVADKIASHLGHA